MKTSFRPMCRGSLLAAALVTVPAATALSSDMGRVKCEISENSSDASGTVTLEAGGKAIVSGACDPEGLEAPAGTYVAVIRLDGALDTPEQRQKVTVAAGAVRTVRANFDTGTLRIMIRHEGRPAAGTATIRKAAKEVGTLASGVSGHLSVGSYEVVAHYRGQDKPAGTIEIKAGQQHTHTVDF